MKKILFPILACALLVSACQPKTSSSTKKSSSSSSSSGASTGGSGTIGGTTTPTPGATSTTSPTIAYRKLTGLNAAGTRTNGQVVWSSSTDAIWKNKPYFTTDSKLQIQFRPKSTPGIVSGLGCTYTTAYGALQAVVAVRAAGSNTYSDAQTVSADVGSGSEVIELIPPKNATSFVIDVYNLKWDFDCEVYYANASASFKAAYCPFAYVWPKHCAQFDIYMATDETANIE